MNGPDRTVVEICSALGDDTRWAILRRLEAGAASASALAEGLPVTRQAISRHLEILRGAGLVERERHGRELRYRAVGTRLGAAANQLGLMAAAWDRRLELLRERAISGAEPGEPG
ncbi:ArsR/SmtB family transcription factor [Actinoalloteichus caeruleus]|uniref:ArsR/SmtB family transcription factor n=1 Tax=Actinoalloteichus cyanogriseus TaxID=2893586 RepID=UPI0004AB67E3|nr:metalloregulator ArsR/SmtB family transcription factor [Actinoalloteichus caeruleus]